MADGTVQIPPDSTGKKVDASSLDVGANSVIRQRVVIGDNTSVSGFAIVAGGALTITGTVNVSATASVVLATGTANIGTVNVSNTPAVVLAAGTANFGTLNNISKTVDVMICGFKDNSGQVAQLIDSANAALRVAGPGTNGSLAIGGFVDPSGTTRNVVDSANLALRVNLVVASGTATVVLAAGTANIGMLNNISRTVQVQIATPFILDSISKTVSVILAGGGSAISLTGTATVVIGGFLDPSGGQQNVVDSANTALRVSIINASATVTVTTANPWITNVQSTSHGPKCVVISTSATTTLVTAPGAGNFVYITSIACSNFGTVNTVAQIGSSASPVTIQMGMVSAGGGFVMNFDPPWKVFSGEAVNGRVNPNSSGDCYFNINFFVAAT